MAKSRTVVNVSEGCFGAAVSQPDGQDSEIRIAITVRPGSKRDCIEDGPQGDRLLVRVSAPPIDGRANDAVLNVLAAACAIKKRQLRIVHGHTGREKLIAVTGNGKASLAAALLA